MADSGEPCLPDICPTFLRSGEHGSPDVYNAMSFTLPLQCNFRYRDLTLTGQSIPAISWSYEPQIGRNTGKQGLPTRKTNGANIGRAWFAGIRRTLNGPTLGEPASPDRKTNRASTGPSWFARIRQTSGKTQSGKPQSGETADYCLDGALGPREFQKAYCF